MTESLGRADRGRPDRAEGGERLTRVGDHAIVDFEAPPGLQLTNHEHEQAHIVIMLSGAFEEEDRGRTEWLEPGSTRFSPCGDRHNLRFSQSGGRCLLLHVPERFGDLRLLPERRQFVSNPWLRRVAGEPRNVAASAQPNDGTLEVDLLLVEMLAQSRRPRRSRASTLPPWLARLRDRLHDDPFSVPTLIEVSLAAQRHPTHVARAFREHLGRSLTSYVRALRLVEARRAIVGTREPLADVAARCGFADQSHMTRWFRRDLATTPAALRLEHQPPER